MGNTDVIVDHGRLFDRLNNDLGSQILTNLDAKQFVTVPLYFLKEIAKFELTSSIFSVRIVVCSNHFLKVGFLALLPPFAIKVFS